jgi:hypothetical protein
VLRVARAIDLVVPESPVMQEIDTKQCYGLKMKRNERRMSKKKRNARGRKLKKRLNGNEWLKRSAKNKKKKRRLRRKRRGSLGLSSEAKSDYHLFYT